MKGLIDFFLDNKVAANLLAAILVVGGILIGSSLVVRLFPEVKLYAVNVTVPFPGGSPEDVEESIVEPIEEQLEGLEGVEEITSVAAENVANIVVELRDGADTNELVNDVRTEIGQITVFPAEAEEPQITELESNEIIAQIVLAGEVDPVTLKRLAEETRSRLAATSAISDARIAGIADYLIDISVSEAQLQGLGLSLPQLAQIVRRESLELSGGEIEGAERRTLVRTLGENELGSEFEEIVVTNSDSGTPVRLGDIAAVTDGLSEQPIEARYDGRPAVAVNVYRVGDERVFAIIDQVREELVRLEDSLPPVVEVVLWQDESTNLRSRIDLLVRNAILGLVLVTVLLLLFLDVRIAFWVAVGVGISFIGALIPMGMFGVAISQLSLFGFILGIGIVVDDAIVVGENIYSTLEKGEVEGQEAARRGTLRVTKPVLFSVSTTVVAFAPLLFLPETFGQFLGPIAAVVIFVLVLSLIESFLILPKHVSHLSMKPPPKWSPRRFADPVRQRVSGVLDRFSDRRLRPAIGGAVAHPIATLLIAFGALAATVGLVSGGIVRVVFFPEVEGNFVTAEVELAENASETETRRAAERIVAATEGVATDIAGGVDADADAVIEGVFWTLGESLSSAGPGGAGASGGAAANRAFITVKIQDAAVRNFTASTFENRWREVVGEIPGAQKLSFSSDLVAAGAAVTVEVSGRDREHAREVVAALRQRVEAMNGTISVRDDRFRTTDEVQIRLLPQARSLGLTLEDVAGQVRAAYFGAEAVRIQRDREEIEVRIRYTEAERSNLTTILNQRIFVNGTFVPIRQVADVSIGDAPSIIRRKQGQRIFTLESDVDSSVTTSDEVSTRIFQEFWPELQSQYPDVEVTPGGEQEEQGRVQSAMSRNFGIALIGIYALLALAFNSYTQPLVVMSAIPFGLIGAILGHALVGVDLTLLSIFGIIGLSGVIINDALLMVDYINEALENGSEPRDAIVDSAVSRFRPILLTSLTTFLGVTPIILEQSVQAAFLVPTAVALGFGILFGTIVLTLVVPACASLHARGKRGIRKAARRIGGDQDEAPASSGS